VAAAASAQGEVPGAHHPTMATMAVTVLGARPTRSGGFGMGPARGGCLSVEVLPSRSGGLDGGRAAYVQRRPRC